HPRPSDDRNYGCLLRTVPHASSPPPIRQGIAPASNYATAPLRFYLPLYPGAHADDPYVHDEHPSSHTKGMSPRGDNRPQRAGSESRTIGGSPPRRYPSAHDARCNAGAREAIQMNLRIILVPIPRRPYLLSWVVSFL